MRYALLILLLLFTSCVRMERSARLAKKEKERQLGILDEARALLQQNPEWMDSIAGPPKIDTVVIPKVVVETRVITRIDTQTVIQYVDTLSKHLFGRIDGLQADLLRSTVMEMAGKMAAKSLPDTTIRFFRRLEVQVSDEQIMVNDTVSLDIKQDGKGYVFQVGNIAKRIPVKTQVNKVNVAPSVKIHDKFYSHAEWWAVFGLCLVGWYFAMKK